MIEDIKACKGRKSLENIELRNVQSQNLKYLSSDHRLFWVENNGNWEKMNAAQNIDCPKVDIAGGSYKEVLKELNFNGTTITVSIFKTLLCCIQKK